jgi:hypothetical protein
MQMLNGCPYTGNIFTIKNRVTVRTNIYSYSSAALTAPRRPHLSTGGAPVDATRVAAHWRSSPLVVVVGSGAAPPL